MKSIFWVWENPHCNGINPAWVQLTGQEYYALVNSPESKARRFVKLPKVTDSDVDVFMEATESAYAEWKKEKNRSDYLRKHEKEIGYKAVSYHSLESKDGCFGEEILCDESCDVEAECLDKLEREEVMAAVARLSVEEQEMVKFFWLSGGQGTERDYSALTGIPYTTVHDRKIRILRKLKKYFQN